MGSKASKQEGYKSECITNDDLKDLDSETKKIGKYLMKHKVKIDQLEGEGSRAVLYGDDPKSLEKIKSLLMNGNNSNISKIKSGLPDVLKRVNNQVIISSFKIDKSSLKMIIENCAQLQSLVFYFCEMPKVSRRWVLDSKIEYKIISLDLFGSCHKSWSDHLTEKKLNKLVRQMALTNLKDSLKIVHTKEDWFSTKSLQPIFDNHGFKLTVHGDNKKPVLEQ
jgi:hypothetical protein